jgi:hypothetical protein
MSKVCLHWSSKLFFLTSFYNGVEFYQLSSMIIMLYCLHNKYFAPVTESGTECASSIPPTGTNDTFVMCMILTRGRIVFRRMSLGRHWTQQVLSREHYNAMGHWSTVHFILAEVQLCFSFSDLSCQFYQVPHISW